MKRFAIIAIVLSLTTLASAAFNTTTYVDPLNGNDLWDGSSPTYIGGTQGPKATIQNAQENAYYNSEIILADGIYFVQETTLIRTNMSSYSGTPENCVINANSDSILFECDLNQSFLHIQGITISGNLRRIMNIADTQLLFNNCRFENMCNLDMNLLQISRSLVTFDGCVFSNLNAEESLQLLEFFDSEVIFKNCEITNLIASEEIIFSNGRKPLKFISSKISKIGTTLINDTDWDESKVIFENSSIQLNSMENSPTKPLIWTRNLEIKDSTISYNEGCVIRAGSNLKIIDSTISYNEGCVIRAGSNLKIIDSAIINNKIGSSPMIVTKNAEISNCSFRANSRLGYEDYVKLFYCTPQYSPDQDQPLIFNINNTQFTYNELPTLFEIERDSEGVVNVTNSQLISNDFYSYGDGDCYTNNHHANFINVLFAKNESDLSCAIPSTIINCTFNNPKINHVELPRANVSNCIFYPDEITSRLSISYSLLCQRDDSGAGNIIIEPYHSNPGFADAENNDYHLLSEAGRYNPATGGWVRDDVTSPCIDAGDPASDFLGEPIGSGGRINMGAYGNTAQASLTNRCSGQLMGDINKDCNVNLTDVSYIINDWLETTIVPD